MSEAIFALNGEPIRMKNLTVAPSLKFKEKDRSGQTSSTDTAEQGTKAKELKVSGLIPFTDEKQLVRLFEMAESKSHGGERSRYRVANHTANAVKFRIGIFAENIEATEQNNLMAWSVKFTLREQNSVSEKRESRLNTPANKLQIPGMLDEVTQKTKDSLVYRFSRWVNDDVIGPVAGSDESNTKTKN